MVKNKWVKVSYPSNNCNGCFSYSNNNCSFWICF